MTVHIMDFERQMLGVAFRSLFGYDKVQAWEANSRCDIGGTILEDGEIRFTVGQAYGYILALIAGYTRQHFYDDHDDDPEYLRGLIGKLPSVIEAQSKPNGAEWRQILFEDRVREALSPRADQRGWYFRDFNPDHEANSK